MSETKTAEEFIYSNVPNEKMNIAFYLESEYVKYLMQQYSEYYSNQQNQELQMQVEVLKISNKNHAVILDKKQTELLKLKEAADEMAIELIEEILHNCIDRESVEIIEFIKFRANTSAYMAISKKDDNLVSLVSKNIKHNTIKNELIKLRNSIYSADPTGHEIVIKDLAKQCDYILKKLDIPYKHLTNKP